MASPQDPHPDPGLPVSEIGSWQPRDPESRQGPGEQEALAGRVFHGVFGVALAAAAGACVQPPSPARRACRRGLYFVYPIAVGTG